jgi:hypothetical protein
MWEIHETICGNIRKYMIIDNSKELAFILYVLTCVLNVWTCFLLVFLFWGFSDPSKKTRAGKT